MLAPSALFHANRQPPTANRQPSSLMRINFSNTQDAVFGKVFARVRG